MSNNAELINNPNECNLIEEAISKKLIKYYEFDQFYNLREIGSGGFGKVYCADWKSSHNRCALKSFFNFDNATVKEIVREVVKNISIVIIFMFLLLILFICYLDSTSSRS
jgi:hypothetical protein